MDIRAANPGDEGALCELYYKLHPVEEVKKIKSGKTIAMTSRIKDITFVAKERDKLVGFVLGLLITYADFTHGSIEELFVSRNFRRKGIGKSLLKRAIKEFRKHKARAVVISTDNDNRAAKGLFRELGFRKDSSSYIIRF